jgi:hypothetical protein
MAPTEPLVGSRPREPCASRARSRLTQALQKADRRRLQGPIIVRFLARTVLNKIRRRHGDGARPGLKRSVPAWWCPVFFFVCWVRILSNYRPAETCHDLPGSTSWGMTRNISSLVLGCERVKDPLLKEERVLVASISSGHSLVKLLRAPRMGGRTSRRCLPPG